MNDQTFEQFKQDVVQKTQERHASRPGTQQAFNPAGFLHRIDGFLRKVKPLVVTLAPPQYAILVEAVVSLIEAGDTLLSPANS